MSGVDHILQAFITMIDENIAQGLEGEVLVVARSTWHMLDRAVRQPEQHTGPMSFSYRGKTYPVWIKRGCPPDTVYFVSRAEAETMV